MRKILLLKAKKIRTSQNILLNFLKEVAGNRLISYKVLMDIINHIVLYLSMLNDYKTEIIKNINFTLLIF